MLASYVTGVGALVVLVAAWVGVQRAWKHTFPERSADPDALAGRLGCHGDCGDECSEEDCPLTGGEERT